MIDNCSPTLEREAIGPTGTTNERNKKDGRRADLQGAMEEKCNGPIFDME